MDLRFVVAVSILNFAQRPWFDCLHWRLRHILVAELLTQRELSWLETITSANSVYCASMRLLVGVRPHLVSSIKSCMVFNYFFNPRPQRLRDKTYL